MKGEGAGGVGLAGVGAYLVLDLYFQDGADDAQRVADDDEDVPAAHKLQLVGPGGVFPAAIPAVLAVLLVTARAA